MSSTAVDVAGPAVDVQSHPQGRAQRSPGQEDVDPARASAAIVLDRPAQHACAEPEFAARPGALLVIKCGHAGLQRNVHNPPE